MAATPESPARHRTAAISDDLAPTALFGIALAVGLLVLGLAIRDGPPPLDTSMAAWIAGWYPGSLTDLFDILASLPVVGGFGIAAVAVAFRLGRPATGLAFLVGLASEVPTALAKVVFDRARPPGSGEIEAFGPIASYPSGHTVRTVVIVGLVVVAIGWRHLPPYRRLATAAAFAVIVVLVGFARIASGQHWPTDVLGGLFLGGAWLSVSVVAGAGIAHRLAGRGAAATTERS